MEVRKGRRKERKGKTGREEEGRSRDSEPKGKVSQGTLHVEAVTRQAAS